MQAQKMTVRKNNLVKRVRFLSAAVALVTALGIGLASGADSQDPKSSGSRWGADYFPNVPLVTHEGESVRFFDDLIEGKVVVINFIYTHCTDVCPVDTARLKSIQELLGDRVGKDIFMYSISIDPERDTPEVLADYVKRYRVGPGWWFLTGSEEDVLLLRKKLGLYMEGLEKELDHNMSFIIGNQSTGQWMKRSPMDNPYFIADQIGSWLTNWKTPTRLANNNYATAPQLQPPTMGENLFRTRCIMCHTIGEGNIEHTIGGTEFTGAAHYRGGPDLLHVTHKRDRDWLSRWLTSPEKMLAAEDPIALQIYAEYDEVLMPNLQLNPVEVAALIDYMDAETRRLGQGDARASNQSAHHHGGHHESHSDGEGHAHH